MTVHSSGLRVCSLSQFLSDYNRQKAPVILYGAGLQGQQIQRVLFIRGIDIACFCDRDVKKSGTMLSGKPIVSPDYLENSPEWSYIVISINSISLHAVEEYLNKINYNGQLIYLETDSVFDPDIARYRIVDAPAFLEATPWYLNYSYLPVKNFSQEYIREIVRSFPNNTIKNGVMVPNEITSQYVNVSNGERRTVGNDAEEQYEHEIFLFGNCVIFGYANEDRYTIASILQNNLYQQGKSYCVRNKGLAGFTDIKIFHDKITARTYHSGDLVFLCLPPILSYFNHLSTDMGTVTRLCFSYIYKIFLHCAQTGTGFYFVVNPQLTEIRNPSLIEKHILENYVWPVSFTEPNIDVSLLRHLCLRAGIPFYDMSHVCQRPHNYGEIFIDPTHLSPNGMKLVANALTDIIRATGSNAGNLSNITNKYEKTIEAHINALRQDESLQQYLLQLKSIASKNNTSPETNVGAIVMNCNPFTKGHLYLVEQAAKQVEILYLFILEEDVSHFPFEVRIQLVREGVKHLSNVHVLPSGKYIISNTTFPEYFHKDNTDVTTLDCSYDLQCFCEKIAPVLHIKKRFVGTEPTCRVTNEYNQQMKKLLPAYGISVTEIARLELNINGKQVPVSASLVRRFLEEKNFSALSQIVPDSTYSFLSKDILFDKNQHV